MELAPFDPQDYISLSKNKISKSELSNVLPDDKDRYGDILPNPATRSLSIQSQHHTHTHMFTHAYSRLPPRPPPVHLSSLHSEINLTRSLLSDLYLCVRVTLKETRSSDPTSGYINANWVRGFTGWDREYIAAQGPLPSTVLDFWRMLWESNTRTVVMVTGLVEGRTQKCERYVSHTTHCNSLHSINSFAAVIAHATQSHNHTVTHTTRTRTHTHTHTHAHTHSAAQTKL